MGTSISINFKDGRKWTKDQKHTLGAIGYDEQGGRWSYVQLAEDVGVGQLVADSVGADLLSAATGTVTTAQSVGSDKLVDSGEFGAADDKLLIGALGQINGHADGQAQAFYVKEWIDNNTLRIELLMGRSGGAYGGWEVALTANSVYSLWFPGFVRRSAAGPGCLHRGVAQSAGKKHEYGFVKQSRLGWANVDVDAEPLTVGEGIICAGGGAIKGFPDGDGTENLEEHSTSIVGRAPFGDIAGSTDRLSLVSLNIVNEAESFRDPDMFHAYNLVQITGSA